MKYLVLTAVFIFAVSVNAQHKKTAPVFEQQGNLIKATYYHDNGEIAQSGYYKDNKLHGKWKSYNRRGSPVAIAEYHEGEKTGKWFFWNGEKLSEVDYRNNKIVAVTHWNNADSIAIN